MENTHFRSMAASPAAFRDALIVRTGSGDKLLGSLSCPFQVEPLSKLDAAAVQMANGVPVDQPLHLWIWTKGTSKTTLASVTWLWLLLFSRDAVEIRVGAAKQEQASETLKVIREIVSKNPWLAEVVDLLSDEVRLKSKPDSRIVVVATDDLTGHGGRPTATFVDELSHLSRGDEGFVDTLLSNYIKLKGPVLICSNAGTIKSWQHKKVETWMESRHWQSSTYSEPAPWLSAAEIEATGIHEARIRRLFRGQWTSETENGLSRADVDRAVRLGGPVYQKEFGWVHAIGIDTSSSHDATAVVVARKRGGRSQIIRTFKWLPERGSRIDMEQVEEVIVELYGHYQPQFVVMDNQGSDLVRCQKKGVPVEKQAVNSTAQNEMAVLAVALFASGSVDLFPDDDLIDDLSRMQIEDRPSLGLKLCPPRGREGHGDVGVTSVYALYALKDVENDGLPWTLPPIPQGRDRGALQQMLEDCPNIFAPSSLAPSWINELGGGWPADPNADRPL
jgi:hypothetical protein